MKAIIYDSYGLPEVLHTAELEKPVPGENEVLVRVHASSVNFGDLLARKVRDISSRDFHMPSLFLLMARLDFGLRKPKRQILGSEFSGVVDTAGKAVTKFREGDPVFGYLGQKMGAYAEYFCMPEIGVLAVKPEKISHEEAATIPMGAIMAIYLLREKGNLQPGSKVLVNGASGSIGSAAVQLLKHHFKTEVTGVCSTRRTGYVKSLGADKVIDYTREDFTQQAETYDLVFDVLGKSSFARCKRVLKPNGRYLLASFKLKQLLQMVGTRITGGPSGKKVVCAFAPGSVGDLIVVRDLIEAGKLRTIVDQTFPMEQAAEAHRYVEEGNKKGSVAIRFA
ncbi:MAG TPA: NAD(P)-dependent alcohol dehydrogenase [Bacteroides sp.]|nr:NAD(P)-dependent alcohol dehydrogenase [Bacteroides sp.]